MMMPVSRDIFLGARNSFMSFKIQINQFQGLISGIQSLAESHFYGDLRSMPTVLYDFFFFFFFLL